MPYTREHMEPGELSVTLRADTPRSVLRDVAIEDYAFATIFVTPTWLDPNEVTELTLFEATNDGMAAVYLDQQEDRRVLSGDGMLWWLGEEGDGGELHVSADGTSTESLAAQLGVLVAGTALWSTADPDTADRTIKTLPGTSPRQFLDMICRLYPGSPYEHHVLHVASDDFFTVYVGRRGALFPTTANPTIMLAADGGGGATVGSSKYLVLDGTGDYASTPDASALDVTGDLDIRIRAAATDWTAASAQLLVAKWDNTVNQRSYALDVTTGGELRFWWSTAGTAGLSATSSGASLTNGTATWLRATIDVNDGSGNRVVTFYKSTDATTDHRDVTWTEISTSTTAGTTSIHAGTSALRIGSAVSFLGDIALTGNVYAAAVISGLDDGTVVADPNFTTWAPGSTTVDDDAGRTWTLAGNAYITGADVTTVTGLPCDLELPSVDVRDWRSEIVAGDVNTAINGSATNTPPSTWKDPRGNSPTIRSYLQSSPRTRFVDKPKKWGARIGANKFATWTLNSAAQATRTATAAATAVNSQAETISAEVHVEAVGRLIECGDTVFVWDLERGLVDTDNEILYRGESAHPMKRQVQRMTVPITEGMGVYLRRWDGSSAFEFVDLTRYVEWEEGPATLELGTRTWLTDRRKARPARLNRDRIRRQARQQYLLGRLTFSRR